MADDTCGQRDCNAYTISASGAAGGSACRLRPTNQARHNVANVSARARRVAALTA